MSVCANGTTIAESSRVHEAVIRSTHGTANQIDFVNMIVDHLTEKGQMEPSLLYESPFTDFDPLGVAGVFDSANTGVVVEILESVRKRAPA